MRESSAGLVHVIDDDEPMRRSLAFLLTAAGFRTRAYESAAAFLTEAPALSEGCVVTDVRMPGMNGIELVRHLQSSGAEVPVIVITGHGDVPLAVEAMKAGVLDFLEKPFEDQVLLQSVRNALDNKRRASAQELEKRRFEQLLVGLSPREQEVLRGVIAGKTNKTIALELDISPRTVEVYRANVMTKTGAAGLSDLVRMALLARF